MKYVKILNNLPIKSLHTEENKKRRNKKKKKYDRKTVFSSEIINIPDIFFYYNLKIKNLSKSVLI